MKTKIDPEILTKIEEEIKGTVQGIRKLLSSNLKRRTICLLIKDAIPQARSLGLTDIEAVLTAMESLEVVHLKKNEAKGKV